MREWVFGMPNGSMGMQYVECKLGMKYVEWEFSLVPGTPSPLHLLPCPKTHETRTPVLIQAQWIDHPLKKKASFETFPRIKTAIDFEQGPAAHAMIAPPSPSMSE